MNYKKYLTGSIVALITPMDSFGNLDKISLRKLINFHVESKTSAIVSVGTTGESVTLRCNERIDIIKTMLEFADERIPIIAGIGCSSTLKTISVSKKIEDTGVVAFLSVTPYYNKPSQNGLYQHFKEISNNTNLPQILYNVPSRTGCDLSPKTIGMLSKLDNIIAIKEASGDLSKVYQIKEMVDDDFILLSGDDATALSFMRLGGHGVISVTSNVAAKKMVEMCNLVIDGKYSAANILNKELMSLHLQLFYEPNPTPIKWACYRVGLISCDFSRLPMIQLTSLGQKKLENALKIAGVL
ncbi:4-hydroxy-tetrahydrodipicolinate synthase [Candidatus Providencia siddallii]|uniref:4-hydroxy-tetrahydrodipicolinate synthase n=1 Tax=Candidatus Providencia siddallii TaxID=1715285 RepID=A0A0M6W7G8_9GAMM|nr:4-hydroxy-tetrahydrodipicolinate synthase [Candidatus Providencia siddallii]